MEFSEEVLNGLASLKDVKRLSDQAYDALVGQSLDIAAALQPSESLLQSKALSGIKVGVVKQLFAALVTLVMECAKKNTDPLELTDFLTQQQIPAARVEVLAKKYAQILPTLRQVLARTSFNFPHIVDADWRLDYYVRSDTLDKANRTVFFLRLKTREGPEQKFVEFSCTVEQLQDLVNKLQDATHSLNRLDLA